MPERATIYTYPWDLADEGIDQALGRIADTAGLNSISLAQSYHISTYFLPHNPVRPLYWGEEGAVYFQPSESFYRDSPIEPLVSETVDGPGYMLDMVARIKARGLDFTSWLVFNYNHHLPARYPEAAKKDPFGHINLAQLCPASPLTRGYTLALCRDILDQFQPDEVNLESLAYLHFNYGFRNPKVAAKITPLCELLMGLCWCPHCLDHGRAGGIDDVETFRAEVADFLRTEFAREPNENDMDPPGCEELGEIFSGHLQLFLAARIEAATSLMQEAIALCRRSGARVSFFGGMDPVTNGLDPDRFLSDVYMVNAGIPDPEKIAGQRSVFPDGTGLSAIVSPGGYADQVALVAHLDALAAGGIDGFAFYNYGLMRQTHLEWIGASRGAWC